VQREVVPLASLPEHLPETFVAVEDQRFHRHRGVDYRRVVGALLADIRARAAVQGSSTITMQLARNLFPERLPGQRKTIRRKLLEVRVARDIERRFSKDEILELYLNHIYFGGGTYGIEAAAQHYFRRSAANLDLSRSALLAALPKGPNLYDPRRAPERARERRNLVLRLMAEQERISEGERQRAAAAGLGVSRSPPSPRRERLTAPYFADAVRRVLEDRFGDELYTSALRIHTTLDLPLQRAAEQELERQLRAIEGGSFGPFAAPRYGTQGGDDEGTPYLQGIVIVLDADAGDVLAYVGGRDYDESTFDRAARARRQPGSAFKPFVYAAALASGYAASQHIADEPLRLELRGGEVWEPRNFDGVFRGDVTLRESLAQSRNVPTVRLASAVGMRRVSSVAARTGISTDIPAVPSAAMGVAPVAPLELVAAYTAFATLGDAVSPRFVLRVDDPDERTLWEPRPQRRRALRPPVAYLITDMLSEAVERGTATGVRRAGFRGPAAGKTGTTNEAADVWFVGYTPELVGGVWIGFDQPRRIAERASGGAVAAPLWGRLMSRAYANRPLPAAWERPGELVERPVDPASGLVLRAGCRPSRGDARTEYFLRGQEPATTCPEGEPARRGLFAGVGSWLRSAVADVRDWFGRVFGRERGLPEPDHQDEYLGAPRLPRAGQPTPPEGAPRPVEESDLLGVPVDPETLWIEVPETDEPPPAPLPGDTVLILRESERGLQLDTAVVQPDGRR
jgi:penicillin-binding protein 1A